MNLCAWYWRASAAVTGTGLALTVISFDDGDQRFLLGLALLIIGFTVANTAYIATRSRTLEEEFDAGFRVGYRKGRRAPRMDKVTPIRRATIGLSAFNKAVQGGGVPEAPVGALAGHDTAP